MSSTKVVTGKVRFSYAHVFEPTSMDPDEKKKYSTAILIPKKDTKTVAAIQAAIKQAIEEGKSKHFAGKTPPTSTLKLPLRDGDREKPDDENYKGMWFLNANSYNRPGVVDANRNEIIDKDEFYSGCYGRASINFYAFSGKSKGVAAGLNGVQKLEDGENLSGGRFDADEDFGDNDDLS